MFPGDPLQPLNRPSAEVLAPPLAWWRNPSLPIAALQEEEPDSAGKQSTGDDEHAAGEQAHSEEHAGEDHAGDDHAGDDHGEAHGSLMDHYLGADHLIGHTQDKPYFELPALLEDNKPKIYIPRMSPWTDEKPLVAAPKGMEQYLGPITFQPTKFVILELLAALIVATLFIWLGRRVSSGEAPRGRLWNMLEAMVIYFRDDVAKAAIGSHDYRRFVPFIWTIFFFILTMNLMGMFPLLGTPTGNISVTIALALWVFVIVLGSGMKRLGVVGFWKAQVPHMDLPYGLGYVLKPLIWAIEVFGLFIKHMVLAVRLFANMFAGHLVLAVFVGFIGATWGGLLVWLVAPASITASLGISLLEVLVAFIQAYVFTFLTALFIGAAIHPH